MSAADERPAAASAALRVGIVAGEHSGDQLGAALIAALRERVPGVQCFGVAGPKMIAQGCEAWAPSEDLAHLSRAHDLGPGRRFGVASRR